MPFLRVVFDVGQSGGVRTRDYVALDERMGILVHEIGTISPECQCSNGSSQNARKTVVHYGIDACSTIPIALVCGSTTRVFLSKDRY